MSLDMSLVCPHCGAGHFDANYTYNVAPMWYAAMPEDDQMVQIDGMTGEESIVKLKAAIDKLRQFAAKFEAMNPENGWGSYSGFVKYLEKLLAAAREQPTHVWRACR